VSGFYEIDLETPDLSALDFYLLGFLKDRVYNPSHTSLKELKVNNGREIRGIEQ